MTVRQLIHVLMELDLNADICLMTTNTDQDDRYHQFGITGVNTEPQFNSSTGEKRYCLKFENRDFITKKEEKDG